MFIPLLLVATDTATTLVTEVRYYFQLYFILEHYFCAAIFSYTTISKLPYAVSMHACGAKASVEFPGKVVRLGQSWTVSGSLGQGGHLEVRQG